MLAEHQHICLQCEGHYDADGVLEEVSEDEYECNCGTVTGMFLARLAH